MYLQGMRYQDHAWGTVVKVLGEAAPSAFSKVGVDTLLDDERFDENQSEFCAAMIEKLFAMEEKSPKRFQVQNWLGEDVLILSLDLVKALALPEEYFSYKKKPLESSGESPARGKYFQRLMKKLSKNCSGKKRGWQPPDNELRNDVTNVFRELRFEVDAYNFRACTNQPMTPSHLGNLSRVERAAKEVRQLIENQWNSQPIITNQLNGQPGKDIKKWYDPEYVELILGRKIEAEPIEAIQLRKGGRCKIEWLMNWSQHYERFHPPKKNGSPDVGPFHKSGKHYPKDEKTIAKMLHEIDPFTGPHADLISINMGGLQFLDALEYVGSNVVEDEMHDSRVLLPPNQDPEGEDILGEEEPEASIYGDELGSDWPEFGEEGEPDDATAHIFASPGRVSMNSSSSSISDPDGEEHEIWFDRFSSCLDPFPLPIQAGLLLLVGKGHSDNLLLEALEGLGVFDMSQCEVSLDVLNRAALARWLGRIEEREVTPYLFKARVDKSLEIFMECCKSRLSGSVDRGGKGDA